MPSANHTETTYKITNLEDNSTVFETSVEGDVNNVTMPTDELAAGKRYKLDVTYKTDNNNIRVNTPQGQLASVIFKTSPLVTTPGIDRIQWVKHKYGGSTLLETVVDERGITTEGLDKDEYNRVVDKMLRSIDGTFLRIQESEGSSGSETLTSGKQNIIVMPVILANGKASIKRTLAKLGSVPAPTPVTPPLPFNQLPPRVLRDKEFWNILKPNVAENNGGITNLDSFDNAIQVASYKAANNYPGPHTSTQWQVSFIKDNFDSPELDTEDPQYRLQLNVRCNRPSTWVYVRYRFKSNYEGYPKVSPWSDVLKYKTPFFGIKDFNVNVTVGNDFKATITASGFDKVETTLSGTIGHKSTTYIISEVESGTEVFKVANDTTNLLTLTADKVLDPDKEYLVKVIQHSENTLVPDKMVTKKFKTNAAYIDMPELVNETFITHNEDNTKFYIDTKAFSIHNSSETHVSTTWNIFSVIATRNTTPVLSKVKDTESKTRLDITSLVVNSPLTPQGWFVEVTFHSETMSSKTLTTWVSVHPVTLTKKYDGEIQLSLDEHKLPKYKVVFKNEDIKTKTIKSYSFFMYDMYANGAYHAFNSPTVSVTIPNVTSGGFVGKTITEVWDSFECITTYELFKNYAKVRPRSMLWHYGKRISGSITLMDNTVLKLKGDAFGVDENRWEPEVYFKNLRLIDDGGNPTLAVDFENNGYDWVTYSDVKWFISDLKNTIIVDNLITNSELKLNLKPHIDSGKLEVGKGYYAGAMATSNVTYQINTFNEKADPKWPYIPVPFFLKDIKVKTPYVIDNKIARHNPNDFEMEFFCANMEIQGNIDNEVINHATTTIRLYDYQKWEADKTKEKELILDITTQPRNLFTIKRSDTNPPRLSTDLENVDIEYGHKYELAITYTTDTGLVSGVSSFIFTAPSRPNITIEPPEFIKDEIKYDTDNDTYSYHIQLDESKFKINHSTDQTHLETEVHVYENHTKIKVLKYTDDKKYDFTITDEDITPKLFTAGKQYSVIVHYRGKEDRYSPGNAASKRIRRVPNGQKPAQMPNHESYFRANFVSYHKDKLRYLITTNGVDIDPETILCGLDALDSRATKNLPGKEGNVAHYAEIASNVSYEYKTLDKGTYVVTFDKIPPSNITPRINVIATNKDEDITDDGVRYTKADYSNYTWYGTVFSAYLNATGLTSSLPGANVNSYSFNTDELDYLLTYIKPKPYDENGVVNTDDTFTYPQDPLTTGTYMLYSGSAYLPSLTFYKYITYGGYDTLFMYDNINNEPCVVGTGAVDLVYNSVVSGTFTGGFYFQPNRSIKIKHRFKIPGTDVYTNFKSFNFRFKEAFKLEDLKRYITVKNNFNTSPYGTHNPPTTDYLVPNQYNVYGRIFAISVVGYCYESLLNLIDHFMLEKPSVDIDGNPMVYKYKMGLPFQNMDYLKYTVSEAQASNKWDKAIQCRLITGDPIVYTASEQVYTKDMFKYYVYKPFSAIPKIYAVLKSGERIELTVV